jgi:hypothetical protein
VLQKRYRGVTEVLKSATEVLPCCERSGHARHAASNKRRGQACSIKQEGRACSIN